MLNNATTLPLSSLENLTLNFGPQHPAAHGVLRLLAELDGEIICNLDAHIGLLHRGTEKLIEHKTYLQSIPQFDRLDYVSVMAQEHTFALSIEAICGLHVSSSASISRVIFLELTRILNHLLAITTHALDVGAITPFFWGFEERERLMEFYERVSGARMHAAFIRPGGIAQQLPNNLMDDIIIFCNYCSIQINEFKTLLSNNRIWRQRLISIGIVSAFDAKILGFSGVMLRGSGVSWDLRKNMPYECYDKLSFNIPLGLNGDCYDRFLVRMDEMLESIKIIEQLVNLANSSVVSNFHLTKRIMHRYMEAVIYHFKSKTSGILVDQISNIYIASEAPKGEFGVYLVSDGSGVLNRCRIRAPGFFHLQALEVMAINHTLADLVTIIGTQDIVFGEVDR